MLGRIYGLLWATLAATTLGLYFAGYLTELALTLVGFLTATLVFIGMAVMLPVAVGEQVRT